MKLEYAVLGLGKFGMSVAKELASAGVEVLAVDRREEAVHEIADCVTYAAIADVTEPGTLESLGVGNMDGAIISIAENMEASIIATIVSKELGVPYVIAKAENSLHQIVLNKVGADKVIFPEQDMGMRVARNIVIGNFLNLVELSPKISMIEMEMKKSWVGKTLRELDLRKNYGFNVVALKDGEDTNTSPDPDEKLRAEETIMITGKNSDLLRLKEVK
ncbi:MAG: potassium channel family protein [Lachnospiraceae bacterium]